MDHRHKEIALYLIEQSADVQASYSGTTPLHKAVEKGWHDLVVALIEHGARTDIKDSNLKTPFMIAVAQKNKELVALLKPKN